MKRFIFICVALIAAMVAFATESPPAIELQENVCLVQHTPVSVDVQLALLPAQDVGLFSNSITLTQPNSQEIYVQVSVDAFCYPDYGLCSRNSFSSNMNTLLTKQSENSILFEFSGG